MSFARRPAALQKLSQRAELLRVDAGRGALLMPGPVASASLEQLTALAAGLVSSSILPGATMGVWG